MLCNFQIFSGCVGHLKQLYAQSPFLFPIVFGNNLIPFFDICTVLAVLSPRLSRYVLLYLGHCAVPVATVAICGFGSWSLVFHCGLPRQNLPSSPSPPPPPLKQKCTPRWVKASDLRLFTIQRSPWLNKHVLQICLSSLSAVVQTVQVSVEPRLSTALKDRSVVPQS